VISGKLAGNCEVDVGSSQAKAAGREQSNKVESGGIKRHDLISLNFVAQFPSIA